MNQKPTLISDESANYLTPWPKTPEPHPTEWLSGVQPWPGLPPNEFTKPLLTAPDRKAIIAILARYDDAEIVRAANDIPRLVHEIRQGERDGIGYTASAVLCEKNKRTLALLDVCKYDLAVAEKAACEIEAAPLAAKIALAMASALWTEFDGEVALAETRLQRFGIPLAHDGYQDGVVTVHELHTDSVLLPLYLRVWFLQHYFAVEFETSKYWKGTPLGWLRELVSEG